MKMYREIFAVELTFERGLALAGQGDLSFLFIKRCPNWSALAR